MDGVIYILRDPNTNECRYVGKTIRQPERRLDEHLSEARMGVKSYKNNWIRKLLKIGTSPIMEIIANAEESLLSSMEIDFIREFRDKGYPLTNTTDGGEGISGWCHSEEAKRKIGEAQRNMSQATRDKKRQSMLGKKHSDEAKERHRKASLGENNPMYGRTGKKNPMYGKPRSEETKRKISEANKGKPGPKGRDQRGEKNPMYGKHHSEESKRKISEAIKGKTGQFGAKNPMYGKHHSEETRRKLSESIKRAWKRKKNKNQQGKLED